MQFLLLGALLYGAATVRERSSDPQEIMLTDAAIVRLEQRYRQQFGTVPSAEQLSWLIERHVRDEMLYREGVALGLAAGDEVVRRRIVQKMDFLIDGDGMIGEPAAAELRIFYEANAARYQSPARVSFRHLYFSPDRAGDAAARARAASVLERLQARWDGEAVPPADRFWEAQRLERADPAEVERVFGRGELAAKVFELPTGEWTGPLRSGFGWHLVRVAAHEPPRALDFAEIQPELRADWQDEQRSRHRQAALERMIRGYRVVREQVATSPAAWSDPVAADSGQ